MREGAGMGHSGTWMGRLQEREDGRLQTQETTLCFVALHHLLSSCCPLLPHLPPPSPPPLHTAPPLQRRNSVQPWLFWNSSDQAGLRLRDPLHVTVASQRMPICCDYFLTKHYPGNCTEQETWSACLLLGINFSFECLF